MAIANEKLRILGDYDEVIMREGLQKGLLKGKQESQQEIALKMKADGMASDLIAKYTGLSLAEIAEI